MPSTPSRAARSLGGSSTRSLSTMGAFRIWAWLVPSRPPVAERRATLAGKARPFERLLAVATNELSFSHTLRQESVSGLLPVLMLPHGSKHARFSPAVCCSFSRPWPRRLARFLLRLATGSMPDRGHAVVSNVVRPERGCQKE